MRTIKKHDAIVSLIPGAELIMEDDVVIQWIKPTECNLTDEEIEAEVVRLQAEEAAKAQAKVDAKQAAEAKLAKLGLTAEDLKTILS